MVPEALVVFAGKGDYPMCALEGARAAGVRRILVAGVRGMVERRVLRAADNVVAVGGEVVEVDVGVGVDEGRHQDFRLSSEPTKARNSAVRSSGRERRPSCS